MVIEIIYVDDSILLASHMSSLKALKAMFEKVYERNNLDELHFYFGIEFVQDIATHTITMNQSRYVVDVLKYFRTEDCKPADTPLDVNSKLVKLTDKGFFRACCF